VDIYIDGYIGKGDFFSEGFSLKSLREQVNANQGDNVINLYINSGGGDVTEGFAIYDYLVSLSERSGFAINTIGEGIVGSIATVIFQAGKNGKRKIHANSEFFIHNPYYVPQSPEPMEAKDAQALAESLKKAEEKILNFYVQNTSGKSKEDIKEKMNMQTSFSANEAMEWGFVDEVIGTPIQAKKHYAVMAFINQPKQNTMEIEKKFEAFETSLLQKITNLFAPKIKAEMKKTSEGVEIFYEGDITIGTSLWLDEAKTQPAPNGVHTIDGVEYEVADGKIAKVVESSEGDTEALKAQIEALKAELAAKEDALKNSTTEAETLKAQVAEANTAIEEVKTEFKNFKAEIITGGEPAKPNDQPFKGDKTAKPNMVNAVLEYRKNKKQ
jgi:ATP-dependent Clp protease protease subunit